MRHALAMKPVIKKAREFAVARHGKQLYGSRPYSVHLDEVAELASEFGQEACVIAYLHDVVEDTATTLQEIENTFGEFVAECVSIVTDEPGDNRQQRKAATYEKMAKVAGPAELALTVKAADRLANLRNCVTQGNERMLNVYKTEHPVFKKAAYRHGQCDHLWKQIDSLIRGVTSSVHREI